MTYKYGRGRAGGGGQYYLHAGDKNSITIPVEPDRMLIYHTHPQGNPPSLADKRVMDNLMRAKSPQRSSTVIPVGKAPIRFRGRLAE